MGVVLPDEVAWVLDLIGVHWPNVDEDEYRQMADDLRSFAGEIDDGRAETATAVQQLIAVNTGAATEAFNLHWEKLSGKHLHNMAEAGRLLATALDGAAALIEGAKLAAIAQLVFLAGEVAAAQAAAPLTLGLSEVGALGATQVTRIAVKRILKEVEQAIVAELMAVAQEPVMNALSTMATDLVLQLGANALGVHEGVDWSKIGSDGIDSAKDSRLAQYTGAGHE
ncbi:hypothetical protein [Kitasatospora sp. NPDC050543]|uniref:WXG100-like domain-containing protein n=1 Tax=Kitasatospora sp. NPDC050543 TaxID=3364054 RepID=UPI0037B62F94